MKYLPLDCTIQPMFLFINILHGKGSEKILHSCHACIKEILSYLHIFKTTSIFYYVWGNYCKQEAQSHCNIFRQRNVELIILTYNKWFSQKCWLNRKLSTELLPEEFKPPFYRLILPFVIFLVQLIYQRVELRLRKQCYIADQL